MKSRLSLEDRLTIETMLKSGKSVYEIANVLSRPVTTITREIKARAVESNKSAPLRLKNRCVFHMQCEKQHVCAHCLYDGDRKCRLCRQCNSHCPAFVERKCERLNKPPYDCNGCPDEPKCVLRKRYYLHDEAQKNYETGLSESRTGVNITEEELNKASQLKFTLYLYQKNEDETYSAVDINEYLRDVKLEGQQGTLIDSNGVSAYDFVFGKDELRFEAGSFEVKSTYSIVTGDELESESKLYANYKVQLSVQMLDSSGRYITNSGCSDYIIYTNAKIYTNLISES